MGPSPYVLVFVINCYVCSVRVLHVTNIIYHLYNPQVSLSLTVTRSFDATRLTTLASIACLTDTVLRITASDVPSMLSAHYAGTADGPGEAFCFDAGHFALESEYARFHDPLLVRNDENGDS